MDRSQNMDLLDSNYVKQAHVSVQQPQLSFLIGLLPYHPASSVPEGRYVRSEFGTLPQQGSQSTHVDHFLAPYLS